MTYSRPGNRSINIQAAGSSGNTPTVQVNSGSKVTANATYRDNTNPNLIYQNGMKKVEQINKILEFANDTVIPAIATEIDNKAQRDAGEVLSAYSPQEITSGGNQEAIDAYNNLSPLAQKTVIEAQAAQAVATYPAALRGAYNNNPKVFSPGNSPEVKEIRAVAKAAAKAEAMEVAGLSKLPAFQTAQNAAALSRAEGQVSGELYRARINQEAGLRKAQLAQTGGTILSGSFRDIERGSATLEDGKAAETMATRGSLEQIAESSGETEGVAGQAEVLYRSITEAGTTMNPAEKQQFLFNLKEQRNTPLLGVDGTTDLWNVPINDQGLTISQALSQLELEAQGEADQYTYKQQGAKLQAAINKQTEEGDAEAEAILANSFDLLNDPANWMALANLKTKGENRVTSEMQTRQNDIDEQVLLGNTTYNEAVKGILAGERNQVSKQWLESRLGIARRERETGQTGKSPNKPAIDAYKSMKIGSDNTLINEQFRAQVLENISNPTRGVGDEELTTAARGFLIQAETDQRDAYIEIYNEKVAAGEPIDPLEIYKDATARALAKVKERAAKNNTAAPKSAAEALTSYTNTAQSAINKATIANGGKVKIPIEAISPSVQARLQEQGRSWDSLSEREQSIALASSFKGLTIQKGGKPVKIDDRMAADMARKVLQEAKKAGANSPGPGVPQRVPVTEQEEQAAEEQAKVEGYQAPAYRATSKILEGATDYIQKDLDRDSGIPALEAIKKWFNNDGMGDQSSVYVDSFLHMIAGAQPANASPVVYGDEDGTTAFREAWQYGSQGLKTRPLPQVASATQVRPVPTAVGNDQHELFVMIGVAEGTRTPSGGYTKAYYGHRDPGDGNYNRGTVSGGRNSGASPGMVDVKWMGTLTNVQQRMRPQLIKMGLAPGTQGYNRVMFNIMDLTVQSPAAAQDFVGKLIEVRESDWTIEAIAKARADSYINPATGRLDAPGFGNNYQNLITDQRSRAGVYDYRRRV